MSNLVDCPTCGKEISSTASTCPYCGETDFLEITSTYRTCEACNGAGNKNSSECSWCDGVGKVTSTTQFKNRLTGTKKILKRPILKEI